MLLAASLWGVYVTVIAETIKDSNRLAAIHHAEFSLLHLTSTGFYEALILIGCPILMLISVAYICERSIRRREREQSGKRG